MLPRSTRWSPPPTSNSNSNAAMRRSLPHHATSCTPSPSPIPESEPTTGTVPCVGAVHRPFGVDLTNTGVRPATPPPRKAARLEEGDYLSLQRGNDVRCAVLSTPRHVCASSSPPPPPQAYLCRVADPFARGTPGADLEGNRVAALTAWCADGSADRRVSGQSLEDVSPIMALRDEEHEASSWYTPCRPLDTARLPESTFCEEAVSTSAHRVASDWPCLSPQTVQGEEENNEPPATYWSYPVESRAAHGHREQPGDDALQCQAIRDVVSTEALLRLHAPTRSCADEIECIRYQPSL